MLNGIGRPPFIRTSDDARALADQVGSLFLYGFLEGSAPDGVPATALGGQHDD